VVVSSLKAVSSEEELLGDSLRRPGVNTSTLTINHSTTSCSPH